MFFSYGSGRMDLLAGFVNFVLSTWLTVLSYICQPCCCNSDSCTPFLPSHQSVAIDSRRLIKEGELRLITVQRLAGSAFHRKFSSIMRQKVVNASLFLFNDLLLIAKKRRLALQHLSNAHHSNIFYILFLFDSDETICTTFRKRVEQRN